MLRSWTSSPSSTAVPGPMRCEKSTVPGKRRNSPISQRNSWRPPVNVTGDFCSTRGLKLLIPLGTHLKKKKKKQEYKEDLNSVACTADRFASHRHSAIDKMQISFLFPLSFTSPATLKNTLQMFFLFFLYCFSSDRDLLSIKVYVFSFSDGAVLLFATDLDNLIFGKFETSEDRKSERQA